MKRPFYAGPRQPRATMTFSPSLPSNSSAKAGPAECPDAAAHDAEAREASKLRPLRAGGTLFHAADDQAAIPRLQSGDASGCRHT